MKFVTKKIVLEYVLISLFVHFLNDSYKNADMIYNRYNSLLSLPNSFRTVYQIYQGDELNSSEVYSDRIAAYSNYVTPLSFLPSKDSKVNPHTTDCGQFGKFKITLERNWADEASLFRGA